MNVNITSQIVFGDSKQTDENEYFFPVKYVEKFFESKGLPSNLMKLVSKGEEMLVEHGLKFAKDLINGTDKEVKVHYIMGNYRITFIVSKNSIVIERNNLSGLLIIDSTEKTFFNTMMNEHRSI